MKLLYCIPSLSNPGGMERVISEKVNYLINLPNYEIFIVTTDQLGLPLRFELDYRIQLVHLDIDFNGHYNQNLINKYFLHKKKLREYKTILQSLLEKFDIDICISLCGKEIDFLHKLPIKCKKVAEIHFSMNFRKQFLTARKRGVFWTWLGDIRTWQLKQSVRKLDKLIVLTKHDEMQWKQTHSNIQLIPNPNPMRNTTVSTLDNKRVITVGKLDAQKGYDMLVDVWSIVAQKYPDWKLDIFGVGEWQEMLENKISESHLNSSVRLCGSTTNVCEEYLNSSIYVMSSRYEGLPMVLIEAMSCGLPLVSFDCEYGPSDLVIDGENGFLVKPFDIDEMARRICLLIENESLRLKMSKVCLESVKQFSTKEILKQWISLFDDLQR